MVKNIIKIGNTFYVKECDNRDRNICINCDCFDYCESKPIDKKEWIIKIGIGLLCIAFYTIVILTILKFKI